VKPKRNSNSNYNLRNSPKNNKKKRNSVRRMRSVARRRNASSERTFYVNCKKKNKKDASST
jgi:hypothetical protein